MFEGSEFGSCFINLLSRLVSGEEVSIQQKAEEVQGLKEGSKVRIAGPGRKSRVIADDPAQIPS